MLTLQKLFERWFYGPFYGHITSTGYFHCYEPSCPFSVKVLLGDEGATSQPVAEYVVFGLHCHEFPDKTKRANKEMIHDELKVIDRGEDVGNVIAEKHRVWQERAKEAGLEVLKTLSGKDNIVDYACKRPRLSGRQVEENTGGQMTRFAIDMARHRRMKKQERPVNLSDINEIGVHHLLKRSGDEIIIFGLKSAVRTMATTNHILADGTFKCTLHGFSQLYILHAVVKNNVSIPMMFCLVKGKTRRAYTKLLRLVEELATENGTAIFNRPVTLMCDFEAPFIKAVENIYGSVQVKCCFFHFTKNIRTKAQPIVKAIEGAEGERSNASQLAQKTKRRLMMLPLLPEELAVPEVLGLIHRAWTDACPEHRDAFNGLFATVIRTYVGTPPGDPAPVRPRFRPSIWSVSGRSVRTNNSAESVHAQLNGELNGNVFLHIFLSTIEKQMMKGRRRILSGCESESRPVEQAKNRLLAQELDKLLNGRVGVLAFLDNCASITLLETVNGADRIELTTGTVEDRAWAGAKRDLFVAAAHGLFRRLCPGGQLSDDEIMTNITRWSFQVLDPIVVDGPDDEDLSMVEEGPRKSFLDLQAENEVALTRRVAAENTLQPIERREHFHVYENRPFLGPQRVFVPLFVPFPRPVIPFPFQSSMWASQTYPRHPCTSF